MPDKSGGRRRGRPLDPAVDSALRAAAFAVLKENGWRGATIERIAEVAGIARTTVYRRYGSLYGVMVMLLDDVRGLEPVADTGTFRGDLLQTARAAQALWADRGRADFVAALTAARRENADVARRMAELDAHVLLALRPMAERAAARGELRAGADPELLMELIAAVVLQRALRATGPPDEGSAEQIVDALLAGFGA